jgi:hypothetical protein
MAMGILSANQRNPATILTSVIAFVVWGLVGLCLSRWFMAWTAGNLQPGQGTSWVSLVLLFIIAAMLFLGGLYGSVSAWLGRSATKWQTASLIVAFLTLWAVVGD